MTINGCLSWITKPNPKKNPLIYLGAIWSRYGARNTPAALLLLSSLLFSPSATRNDVYSVVPMPAPIVLLLVNVGVDLSSFVDDFFFRNTKTTTTIAIRAKAMSPIMIPAAKWKSKYYIKTRILKKNNCLPRPPRSVGCCIIDDKVPELLVDVDCDWSFVIALFDDDDDDNNEVFSVVRWIEEAVVDKVDEIDEVRELLFVSEFGDVDIDVVDVVVFVVFVVVVFDIVVVDFDVGFDVGVVGATLPQPTLPDRLPFSIPVTICFQQ